MLLTVYAGEVPAEGQVRESCATVLGLAEGRWAPYGVTSARAGPTEHALTGQEWGTPAPA